MPHDAVMQCSLKTRLHGRLLLLGRTLYICSCVPLVWEREEFREKGRERGNMGRGKEEVV